MFGVLLKYISKYRYLVVVITILVVGIGGYKAFLSKDENSYNFEVAKIGNVIQEVSVIGQIKKGEQIELSFKEGGEVASFYIEVGEKVSSGDVLAKLNTTQLYIQADQAGAALDLARAELDKSLAGASLEETKTAQTTVENARVAYESVLQILEDTKNSADDDLNSAYEDSLNVLEASYLKMYNAYNEVDSIQKTYFSGNDLESTAVKQNKSLVKGKKEIIETYLDIAKKSSDNEDIDVALSQTEGSLGDAYDALGEIREICGEAKYRGTVSSAHKSSLDNHKSYLNTALTNVIISQQVISSTELTNSSKVNTAEAEVSSAKGSWEKARDELDLVIANPREEDLNLYQAKIDQARASFSLIQDKINEAVLKAPVEGQIVDIKKEAGERVSVAESVISLIPEKPFQVEVNVPEADIGKIDLENICKITLDAFPGTNFDGKIIEIDPAGTIISGVVYYKTKVGLDAKDSKIRPGMTADVTVVSDFKEGVLIIPRRAVEEEGDEKVVKIVTDQGSFEDRKIETGLKGSKGYVEVLSGLKRGDRVVTFIKSQD